MSEIQKFFEGLPSEDKREAQIFEESKKPETPITEEVKPESDEDEPRKNRRHRRIEQQLEKERASALALNERVMELSEQLERLQNGASKPTDLDPRLLRAFGDSEQGKEVTKIFTEVLSETRREAEERALERFQAAQDEAQNEQRQYEQYIDTQLEALEDKYNVDLTSDAPKARKMRREFLETVQKLSPKDEDGNVTGYADFDSTYEFFNQTHKEDKVDTSRQREIASRSMQRPANSSGNTPTITKGFRGWMKDLNVGE